MLILQCLYINGKVSFYVIPLTEVYPILNLFVVLRLVVIYRFVKMFQNLDVALFTLEPFTADVYIHKL
jgi:hypothetical protein